MSLQLRRRETPWAQRTMKPKAFRKFGQVIQDTLREI